MLIDINIDAKEQARAAWCDSAGRTFNPALPSVIFIHGALNDHSVWAAQAHQVASHGFNALSPDLPGHGRSAGPALTSIDAMAAWLLALMDTIGLHQAMIAGHSMGSLIALEACRVAPERVSRLALLGTAWPMKVSSALLGAALEDELPAIDMVNAWSHAPSTASAVIASARALMLRLAENNPAHLLHTDLSACKNYANGETAASAVRCPTLFILGKEDQMTPPRAAKNLTGAIAHGAIIEVDAGHQMMAAQPTAVTSALLAFASER